MRNNRNKSAPSLLSISPKRTLFFLDFLRGFPLFVYFSMRLDTLAENKSTRSTNPLDPDQLFMDPDSDQPLESVSRIQAIYYYSLDLENICVYLLCRYIIIPKFSPRLCRYIDHRGALLP